MPILFTVYIDDLEVEVVRRLLEVLIVKFADDTKGAKVIESLSDHYRERIEQTTEDESIEHLSKPALKKISVMHVIKLGFAPVSFPPG